MAGKVRIGNYDQRTVPQGRASPYVRALDGGPDMGANLSRAGEELRQMANLRLAREEDDARVYTASAMAQARARASELRRTAFAEAPDGWRGATERVSRDWGALREQALSAAPTDAARRFLSQQFDAYQPLMLEDVAGQEQGARQSWRSDTVRSAIRTDANAVSADPSLYGQAIANHRELIGGMTDMDANERRDRLQQAESELAMAAVAGLIERDPAGALSMLRGGAGAATAEQMGPELGALFGAPVTSARRTPERNAAVGGAANSRHLSGQAVDLGVPARYRGMTREAIEADARARLSAQYPGMTFSEVIFEGDHLHVAWEGGGEPTPADPSSPVARLDADQRLALTNRAQAELDRRDAQYRAGVREQVASARALWGMGEQAPGAPSVETVRQTQGDLAAAAYEIDLQSAVMGATMHGMGNGELRRLASLPPASPNASDRERLDNAVRRQAAVSILEQRDADPMAYAVRQGLVTDTDEITQAIDSGNVSVIGQHLRRRVSLAVEQAQTLGTPPAPLTRGEAGRMRAMMDAMTPSDRIAALTELRRAASMPRQGDRGAYATLIGQIYGDTPGAYAGAVALTRPGVIQVNGRSINGQTAGRLMLQGAAILAPVQTESGERASPFDMPSAAVMRGAFNAYAGDAYANDPDRYENAFQAFRAYYAGAASERGVNAAGLTFVGDGRGGGTTAGDPAAMELAGEAVRAVVGEVRPNAYGGRTGLPASTYLPWGMNEDQFNASLEAGWGNLRQRFPEAELGDDPSAYDYAPDEQGFYTVFYRGIPVADGEGGFVRVRPRLAQE